MMKASDTYFSSRGFTTGFSMPAVLSLLILLMLAAPRVQAQQNEPAASLFPDPATYESVFFFQQTNVEDEILTEQDVLTGELSESAAEGITEYTIANYPGTGVFRLEAGADSAYARIGDFVNIDDLLGDLDFELGDDVLDDLNPDSSAVVMRTGAAVGDSWNIRQTSFSVPIPDTLADLIDLPAGITLGDDADISLSIDGSRIADLDFDNALGSFTARGFHVGTTIDVTITIIVPIIGEVPVPFNLLDNYGPDFYFAEGYGLVMEELEPTEVRIQLEENDLIEVNELITTIDGRTTLKTSMTETPPTALAPQPESELPGLLKLLPNYPNPFNPSTTLSFELAEAAQVSVEIFDLQGRSVDRISAQSFASGQHQLSYDAGRAGLASGVYLYRVEAVSAGSDARLSQSGRFTLLK
jgi:hypothetical protein